MQTDHWVRLVLAMIIFATILQIAGLVSPLWIYLEVGNITVGVGLYYRIGCEAESGNNCTAPPVFQLLPFGYNTAATYEKASWEAIVWMETISASFGSILCILMIVYLVGFGVWKKMNNLNTAMVIIAICAWLPLAVGLIIYIIYYGNVITKSPDINSHSFPWSALMCLIAGVIFFAITFLVRTRCRNRNFIKNAIPTSTDSKIALNPSSKNQLMKRYFTPSPYREERRQALYSSVYSSDKNHLIGNGSTVGAIENTGIEDTEFVNRPSRAIEYNVTDSAQESPYSRIIRTNNLSAGTFTDANITTNAANRGTIYDRNLSSFVNNNTVENYSTGVIENHYDSRIVGKGDFGRERSRGDVVNYKPGDREVIRKIYTQQQWTSGLDQNGERVYGNNTILNRDHGYDTFSEIDSETVYYTGKEGFRPITLNRTSPVNISNIINSTATEDSRVLYTNALAIRHPLRPVQEEYTIQKLKVIQTSPNMAAQKPRNFRVPADHHATTGLQKTNDYLDHSRTYTDTQAPDHLILAPGALSGKKLPYNGTYIYRPYTESNY